MPAGHRPPLAMRLWLWQRRRPGKGEAPEGSPETTPRLLGLESVPNRLRNWLRGLLRNTWLVTAVGAIVLGVAIWAALHVTLAPSEFTIAAGPPDSANVKLAQLLARKFADEHEKVRLTVAITAGPHDSAAALSNGSAALAILPGTIANSPDWRVV